MVYVKNFNVNESSHASSCASNCGGEVVVSLEQTNTWSANQTDLSRNAPVNVKQTKPIVNCDGMELHNRLHCGDDVVDSGEVKTSTKSSNQREISSSSVSINSNETNTIMKDLPIHIDDESGQQAEMDVTCNKRDNLEYWGDAVLSGPSNKKRSWEECCKSCADFNRQPGVVDCNIWVFCGKCELSLKLLDRVPHSLSQIDEQVNKKIFTLLEA